MEALDEPLVLREYDVNSLGSWCSEGLARVLLR